MPTTMSPPVPTTSPTVALRAETLFERTRIAVREQRCELRFDYHIIVSARTRDEVVRDRFAATYLSDLGELHVNELSDEESAKPYVPRGANVAVTLGGAPIQAVSQALSRFVNRGEATSILGVPRLAPEYTFGLRAPAAPTFHPGAMPPPSAPREPSLRILAIASSSYSREYEVTLVSFASNALAKSGSDSEPGTVGEPDTEPYHLRLVPRQKPAQYRLRDVWIDRTSFLPTRIVTAGNFTGGPATRIVWQTTYRDVAGCRVIDEERAFGPLEYGKGRTYDDATIRFAYDTPVTGQTLPTFLFRGPLEGDDVVEPPE